MDVQQQIRPLLVILALCGFQLSSATAYGDSPAPPLTLADVYSESVSPEDYWISEKLDGVRAYWDGQQLLSRSGKLFHAPEWFIANFPAEALDGELWAGRGQFEKTVSIVRTMNPADTDWHALSYQVFDLPGEPGGFTHRLKKLTAIIEKADVTWLQSVRQFQLVDNQQLQATMRQIVANGGEGLMLRHRQATYHNGRSHDLLKLKPWMDAEAQVVGYTRGKGEIQGLTGALKVKTPDGRRFRIGTGLTLLQRQHPPAIGSVITYRYHGLTRKGLPRFASFLRERPDE